MNILRAIKDAQIFRPFLGDDLSSWKRWMTALRCLYGLDVKRTDSRALVEECTGRSPEELPADGFSVALFLVGRRSGKSRISAVIGAYEALFGAHERKLAKGETGVVPIISPSRYQSSIVWKYVKAIFAAPLLAREVVDCRESSQMLVLRNGIEIRILTGDWRTVRGPAVVCAILDEICFFGFTEESRVRSDAELVRALRPALLTTGGKLIGISSKYAQRGYAYAQWKKYHGSNRGSLGFNPHWRTLVWDTPSRTMNPTLSEAEIEREFEEDPSGARSEFGGEWREDVQEFISRAAIEALVSPERKELLPRSHIDYSGGLDLSGGRRDSAALVILHREEGRIVQDLVREYTAPFNPYQIVSAISQELKRWRLSTVTGDNYAGDWPVAAFAEKRVRYRISELSKNALYTELLPVLCGGRESIELLNHPTQTNQLISLERRPRSGGKDVIDHPTNGHDDVANALAVAASRVSVKRKMIGGLNLGLPRNRREIWAESFGTTF
jgi:hypothetical protein